MTHLSTHLIGSLICSCGSEYVPCVDCLHGLRVLMYSTEAEAGCLRRGGNYPTRGSLLSGSLPWTTLPFKSFRRSNDLIEVGRRNSASGELASFSVRRQYMAGVNRTRLDSGT